MSTTSSASTPEAPSSVAARAAAIDAVLPQTQCRQCGYAGCLPYATAIAEGDAAIDRCPPGGDAGVALLARVTGRAVIPLDSSCGTPKPLVRAVIDEAFCIGCTLCIQACPVDAIVGGAKRMHSVIADLCTGCELCVPLCPVDCIDLVETGFAWDDGRAAVARIAHRDRAVRLARWADDAAQRRRTGPPEAVAPEAARKAAILAAAVARAAARREDGTRR